MEILEITRSKLRSELLRLYFLHPEERYYLRELERLLKSPVGNIRRELKKLESEGLFISEKVGNLVYYSLDKKCPLYNEIKNIVLKTVGLGDIFRRELHKLKGINFAFIYGSFAKGEENKGSDVDVLVIGDMPQEKLISAINKIEDKINRTANYVLFNSKELQLRINKKNHFIVNVLRGKKIMLIGKESEIPKLKK